jgi:proline racemase
MFGAILTEPVHEDADFGVLYIDNEMYVNMCGHGTIGCATAAVETGFVKMVEPYTEVVLDTPSGLIHTKVKVENGKAVEVTLQNVPSFLYKENMEITVGSKTYRYDISFGGQFFAMVDAAQTGMDINEKTAGEFIRIGIDMMRKINAEQVMHHPILPIKTVDVVEFYGKPHDIGSDLRNIVVFGNYQADRSPCGTGTSAKLAMLRARGQIDVGQVLVNESFMGSKFKGVVLTDTKIGDYDAVIPAITGSAYLTGIGTYLIDPMDPLKYGFLIG